LQFEVIEPNATAAAQAYINGHGSDLHGFQSVWANWAFHVAFQVQWFRRSLCQTISMTTALAKIRTSSCAAAMSISSVLVVPRQLQAEQNNPQFSTLPA
jgi:hypothetical protein